LYGSGKVGFDRFAGQARDSGIFDTSEEANRAAASAYPTFLENFNEGREINIFDPAPFTYTGIGGIGSSDITGGGGGITPVPIMSPRLPSRVGDESGFLASDLDKALLDASYRLTLMQTIQEEIRLFRPLALVLAFSLTYSVVWVLHLLFRMLLRQKMVILLCKT
jgi:hypothetical protein